MIYKQAADFAANSPDIKERDRRSFRKGFIQGAEYFRQEALKKKWWFKGDGDSGGDVVWAEDIEQIGKDFKGETK